MVTKNKKTKIIAEVGANHMGDRQIAENMVRLAAQIGVDVVKFQSWRAQSLKSDFPDYQATYARHKKAELSDEDHQWLIDLCKQLNIQFLTTCFDLSRVDFLSSLDLPSIKVASPDSQSFKLIDRLIEKFPHVIISTGMTTDEELSKLMGHVRGANVTLMHCVSLYPTSLENINLNRMAWIRSQGFDAGFSDHSLGTEAGKLAIALEASYLEKHYALSRNLPGKDQAMSTEPQEFKELVEWARMVQKMKGVENPPLSETENTLRQIYIGKWGHNK